MSLTRVEVTRDVLQTCMAHALTTEREEVMGLLLGDIDGDAAGGGGQVARVWKLSFQRRVDRRPDRVEISPEQLAAASDEAARWSEVSRRTTRVIGWYHSHPHITVLPSHVDVRTQGQYQLLDSGFIGLIFSVYSDLPDSTSRMQLVAFQAGSKATDYQQLLVPITITETPAEGDRVHTRLLDLQRVQLEEDRAAYGTALEALEQNATEQSSSSHAFELGVAFHSAIYQKALCTTLGTSLPPIAQALNDAKRLYARTIAELEDELAEAELSAAETAMAEARREALAEAELAQAEALLLQ